MSASGSGSRAALREGALRLLSRREHSAAELQAKLTRRGWSAGEVAEVVGELSASGLQSDQRFAESFARQRAERCYGPRRIEAELRERGVAPELIAGAIDSLETDFGEIAASFYYKKYGRADPPEDFRERARRAKALARRGFETEHFRALIED